MSESLRTKLPEALSKLSPADAAWANNFSGGADSMTPALVHQAPEALREVIINSYNDALVPILGSLAPLAIFSALVVCFVRPEKLKETLD